MMVRMGGSLVTTSALSILSKLVTQATPAMLIYLDTCCFNRPFDDQSQTRIRFETAAKLQLQQRVRQKKVQLVWSYLLDFENSQNPFPERVASILIWRNLAEVRIGETGAVLDRGRSLLALGIKPFDALHVACALVARSDLFVTTDDILLRKLRGYPDLATLPPGEALAKVEHWYED